MISRCKCDLCLKMRGETKMHKTDKFVVIRVTVEEAKEIEKAVTKRYENKYLNGYKTAALLLLNAGCKITKQLEIEK